jgi:hypothetical protein
LFAVNPLAAETIGPTKISFVEPGWSGEGLAIHTDKGLSGCGAPDTEFAIAKSHPSYNELLSMTLTAFAAQSNVEIVAYAGVCIFGARTKVVSIRLLR